VVKGIINHVTNGLEYVIGQFNFLGEILLI